MSLNKALRYPGRWNAPTTEYPMGVPKNRTSDTAKDGTYFEKDWLAEHEAFFGALMNNAGISPNGNVDTAEASQFFDAFIEAANHAVASKLIGTPVHSSLVGVTSNDKYIAPALGQKCYVDDYPSAYAIISTATNFIAETTKASDPFQYAGYWGFGNDGADFFTTPNLPLTMHIKSSGSYGNAGESKEDHLQNMTGLFTGLFAGEPSGVFNATSYGNSILFSGTAGNTYGPVTFDSSKVARTDTFTDTMGTFFDPYIWLPKGVF